MIISSMRKKLFIITAFIATAAVALLSFNAVTAHTGPTSVAKPAEPMVPEPDPFSAVQPAKGKFLVATDALTDPHFSQTVILLIDYSDMGATGIIINRPTKVPLVEMLPSVQGLKDRADIVYYGGPVEGNRMFMLIRSSEKPDESGHVFGNVYVSVSKNMLEHMIGKRKTEKQFRVYSGYAGWFPGQLDREVSIGSWRIVGADADSIFEKNSAGIWRELFRRSSEIHIWNYTVPDFAVR